MAILSSAVWEIRPDGNDTNGGAAVPGAGTDFSQQAAKNTAGNNISTTDAVTNGTTTLTSATAAFTSAVVGNVIYLQGGTGALAARRCQVTVFTNATTVTIDRIVAASTGVTLNIGGALASLGELGAMTVSGTEAISLQTVFIRKGGSTYSISSATPNVAGGVYSSTINLQFIGYDTNRTTTNTDAKPLLQMAVTAAVLFTTRSYQYNLELDGNSQAGSTYAVGGVFDRCLFRNWATAPVGASTACVRCTATGNSAAQFTGYARWCDAHANTATPFLSVSAAQTTYDHCQSYNNTGASTDGFGFTVAGGIAFTNLVAYGNGRDGFRNTSARGMVLMNAIAYGNSGAGINLGSQGATRLVNCATGSNSGGGVVGTTTSTTQEGAIALSADPFTNAAGADFSLNTTAGGGALLRGLGAPATFPNGTTPNFIDVNAAQHADPAQTQGGLRLAGRGGLAAGA